MSTLLGLQPDKGNERPNAEILEKLTESGWKWDDENGLWRPGPLPTKDESGGLIGGSTVGDDGMSGLVGLVGFLGE